MFVEETGLTDYTDSILADNIVTFSEYEAAFFEMTACIMETGATFATEPFLDVTMRYTFSLRYPPDTANRVESEVHRCRIEYFEPVSRAWGRFVRPGIEDIFRDARDTIGQCYRHAGGEVDDSPSPEDIRALLYLNDPAFLECVRLGQIEHKLGPVLP